MGYWRFNLEKAKNVRDHFNALNIANGDVKSYIKAVASYVNRDDNQLVFSNCLKNFFSAPHIIDAVSKNDWVEVFKCWIEDYNNRFHHPDRYYGNKPGYPLMRLIHFLALSGVEFEKYLTSKNIPSLSENDLDISGLEWVEEETNE